MQKNRLANKVSDKSKLGSAICTVHMINKNYNVFFYIRHLPMSDEILNNPVDGLSKVFF